VVVVALYSHLVVVVVVQGSPRAAVAVVVPDSHPAVAVVGLDNHPAVDVVADFLDTHFDDVAVLVVVVVDLCNCLGVVDQESVLFYRRYEEEVMERSQMSRSCQNFLTGEFAPAVGEGEEICSQFQQHFTSSFCSNYPFDRKLQTQTVNTQKLHKTLLYRKAARKMLVKIDT